MAGITNTGGKELTRRQFLWWSSLSVAGLLTGCATNPVTGESQLMLVSESQEIQMDKQYSPQQLSADYGVVQDPALSRYIDQTGKRIAASTHRPNMPYSFNPVNATYINAYAFPGGTIACTRGILLSIDNEAELAALLGHELGHVNARHAAESMTKGQLTNLGVGLLTAAIGYKYEKYAWVASNLGMLGAGMLLAKYSRDNEREADDLGMEYMVRAHYNPEGMVGLMDMLKSLHKGKPSAIELMFASHPWSGERYDTSVANARTKYPQARNYKLYRERYMDHTARLRSQKSGIEQLQKGEQAMGQKQFSQAQTYFKNGLKRIPGDYAGLLMMAKCLIAQDKTSEAQRYAEDAKRAYPSEAQAYHVSGFVKMKNKQYQSAFRDFSTYEKRLPGNPTITFFEGYCLEGMQRRQDAARYYQKYLQVVQQGDYAKHAYQRLVEWGYIKPS